MKIQRTEDPDISYAETEGVALWCCNIIKWRVDTRNRKFLITPIMRDRSEGPVLDVTDMREQFQRDQW